MERVKKIILMAVTFVAVVGMTFINNNVAYADNEKTITIHYHRDDANYSGYVLAIWDEYNQGTDYDFKVSGNEATVSYTCSSSEATVVTFVVKPKMVQQQNMVRTELLISVRFQKIMLMYILNPEKKRFLQKVLMNLVELK